MMKKTIKSLLVLGMCIGTVLVFGACSQSKGPGVSQTSLSAEEQKIADVSSDLFAKFKLEKGKSYDITMTQYTNGLPQNTKKVTVEAQDGADTILISGINTDGLNYNWRLMTPGKEEPTVFSVTGLTLDKEAGVPAKISDVGQTSFEMEEKETYLLCYAAFKTSNTTLSISEKPFHEWSTVADKDTFLKDFNCAYLVTISLSPEDAASAAK